MRARASLQDGVLAQVERAAMRLESDRRRFRVELQPEELREPVELWFRLRRARVTAEPPALAAPRRHRGAQCHLPPCARRPLCSSRTTTSSQQVQQQHIFAFSPFIKPYRRITVQCVNYLFFVKSRRNAAPEFILRQEQTVQVLFTGKYVYVL